jgi:hypothetical protein
VHVTDILIVTGIGVLAKGAKLPKATVGIVAVQTAKLLKIKPRLMRMKTINFIYYRHTTSPKSNIESEALKSLLIDASKWQQSSS